MLINMGSCNWIHKPNLHSMYILITQLVLHNNKKKQFSPQKYSEDKVCKSHSGKGEPCASILILSAVF